MSTEQFIINDITLRVNPTDIQAFNQKFVDVSTFIRENSTYAYSSNSAVATYSVTIAFNLNSQIDVNNLIKLSVELRKYPFVWIKSNRLNQFITPIGTKTNEYTAFAIKEWTMKIDSNVKKVIFLTFDMYYFSHIPYVKSWSFLAYDEHKEASKTPRAKNAPIELKDFVLKTVDSLEESNVFADYFAADNKNCTKKFNTLMAKFNTTSLTFGRPLMMKASPQFDDKPKEILENNVFSSGFADQDFKELTFVNTYYDAETDIENASGNFWLVYQDINVLDGINEISGHSAYEVRSVSITKRNTIAIQTMQMYDFPFVQYLGKSPAQLKIDLSINNSNLSYNDDAPKPYEILTNMLREAERLQVVATNKILPFKSLRIRNLLTLLADSHYFVLDSETSFESAEDQGLQIASLSFVESDLTKLIGKNKLKPAGVKDYDFDVLTMIKVIKSVTEAFLEKEYHSYQFVTPEGKVLNGNKDVADKLLKTGSNYIAEVEARAKAVANAQLESHPTLKPILNKTKTYINALSTQVKSFLDSDASIEAILMKAFVGAEIYYERVHGKEPATFSKVYGDDLRKSIKLYDYIAKLVEEKKVDERHDEYQTLIHTMDNVVTRFLNLQNYSKDQKQQQYGNVAAKILDSLQQSIIKTEIKEIDAEAIQDLGIFSSLVAAKGQLNSAKKMSYLGEGDGKRFSPFFFIHQNIYVDASSFNAAYQFADKSTKDILKSSVNMENMTDGYIDSLVVRSKALTEGANGATQQILGAVSVGAQLALSGKQQTVVEQIIAAVNSYNFLNAKAIGSKPLITPEMAIAMAKIETGGTLDPTLINPVNGLYKGLFQVSDDKLEAIGASPSQYADVKLNTYAAMNFWYSFVMKALADNRLPLTTFNLYMTHQQGYAWPKILKGYNDIALRETIADPSIKFGKLTLRTMMAANNPIKGRDKRLSKEQNYINNRISYRNFVEGWSALFTRKTGLAASISSLSDADVPPPTHGKVTSDKLGSKYPAVTKGVKPAPDAQLYATIIRKGASITDGDTVSMTQNIINVSLLTEVINQINNYGRLTVRVFGVDTGETLKRDPLNQNQISHSGKPGKFGIEARIRLQQLFDNAKYPIKVYKYPALNDSGDRDVANIIDSDGVDFNYEMLRGGFAELKPSFAKKVPEKAKFYNQGNILAQRDKIGLYSGSKAPEENINNNRNPSLTNIDSIKLPNGVGFDDIPTKSQAVIDNGTVVVDGIELAKNPDIRKPAGFLTTDRKFTFKGMETSGINLFNEAHQAQYRSLRTGNYMSTGLDMAVPTIKIYMVEGLRDDKYARISFIPNRDTNLYEVFGISDVRIQTADNDNPVAVMAFTVANPGAIYTDAAAIAKNFEGKFDYAKLNSNADYRDKIGKVRLTAGTRLHVRIGYSNDPNELETVFNGEITEVEGETLLEIVAEGYGRELIAVTHNQEGISKASGILNASTSGTLNEILRSEEIYHFGQTYYVVNSRNPYARSILRGANSKSNLNGTTGGTDRGEASNDFLFGVWWDTNSEVFTNIYSPSIEAVDNHFSLDGSWRDRVSALVSMDRGILINFPIFNSTVWDVVKEMNYRHPGTWMNVMNYKERASLFFGIKEQLFIFRDPPVYLYKANQPTTYQIVDKDVEALRWKDLKPAAEFHLITSENHIISNQLKISSGFKTKINIRYFDDNPDADDLRTGTGFKYYNMLLDDNLKNNSIRSMELEMNGCDHKFTAYRYGTAELKNQAEKMYQGKIVIIGNPNMKAGDYAYLADSFRGLNGIIKIRECSHIFNENDGYVTVITPGLYTEASMYNYSNLFTKLGIGWALISNKIKLETQSGYFDNKKMTTISSMLGLVQSRQIRDIMNSDKSLTARTMQFAAPAAFTAFSIRMLYSFVQGALLPAEALAADAGPVRVLANAARNSTVKFVRAIPAVSRSLVEAAIHLTKIEAGGFFGTVGKAASRVVLRTGLQIGSIALTNPVSSFLLLGVAFVGIAVHDTIVEIEQTREPVRLFPLLNNGSPYLGGISGFEMNSYIDSKFKNYETNMDAIITARDNVVGQIFSGGNLYQLNNALEAKNTVSITSAGKSGI